MKSKMACILFVLMLLVFSNIYADETAVAGTKQNTQSVQPVKKESNTVTVEKTPGVGYCLLRGLANVGLGVIALPRQIVYENAEIPVFGLIPGVIYGAGEFVWREFAGVMDLISFGFSGRGLYFKGMNDFPWSPWLPPEYGN